jgi:hypothetical protein
MSHEHANVHPKTLPINDRHPVAFPIATIIALTGLLPLFLPLPRVWEYGFTGSGTVGILWLFGLVVYRERRQKSAAIGHLMLGLFLLSLALLLPTIIAELSQGGQ